MLRLNQRTHKNPRKQESRVKRLGGSSHPEETHALNSYGRTANFTIHDACLADWAEGSAAGEDADCQWARGAGVALYLSDVLRPLERAESQDRLWLKNTGGLKTSTVQLHYMSRQTRILCCLACQISELSRRPTVDSAAGLVGARHFVRLAPGDDDLRQRAAAPRLARLRAYGQSTN